MKIEAVNDDSLRVKLPNISPLNLPTHPSLGIEPYILSAFFGERGSGKTSLVAYILSLIGQYQQKIYWFSSTVEHDEKVKRMLEPLGDKVKYIEEFDKDTLKEVLDEMKTITDDYKQYYDICRELASLYKRVGQRKYYANMERYLLQIYERGDLPSVDWDYTHELHRVPKQPQFAIIIDDELSNPLLMSRTSKNNEFLKMVIKHRHYPYHANIFLLLQNVSSLSNVIRRNLQQWFVSGKISDNNLLRFVFEEVGQLFRNDFQFFQEAIKRANEVPYGFLFINKNNRQIRRNLNEIISI